MGRIFPCRLRAVYFKNIILPLVGSVKSYLSSSLVVVTYVIGILSVGLSSSTFTTVSKNSVGLLTNSATTAVSKKFCFCNGRSR